MLQGEHSAIFSTFIKLPFAIKIFVLSIFEWPLKTGFTAVESTIYLITGDSQDFMSWFLNALHSALNGTKKLSSSVINKTFRGKMKVYSKKVPPLEMVSYIFIPPPPILNEGVA